MTDYITGNFSNAKILLEEFKLLTFSQATIFNKGFVENYRNCLVNFLDKNHWFNANIKYRMMIANDKKWNYDLEDLEFTQVVKYESGGFYDWHTDEDIFDTTLNNHRKLSIVVQLSDASEFTGGGLLFRDGSSPLRMSGDYVIFPSFMEHKAMPVESGERIVVSSFFYGPKFR